MSIDSKLNQSLSLAAVKSASSQESLENTQKNILVGCTGSVASMKIPIIISKLLHLNYFNVQVVATERAMHFFKPDEMSEVNLLTDDDEWKTWKSRGDPVLHIELAKWADLFVIAPLDANTLGKISSGLCDNLLTCVVRAWSPDKPLLFCPAMNTKMYEHPVTSTQISKLIDWGYILIPCISKTLVCGDKGMGAMAEVDTIVENIKENALK